MGIRIMSDDYGVKVFRSDRFGFPQYSISISVKGDDGKWISEYKTVRFRRGVELEDGDEIYIDNAFPTLDYWPDKTTGQLRHKEVWMITEFSYRSRHENVSQNVSQPQVMAQQDLPDGYAQVDDIELPF